VDSWLSEEQAMFRRTVADFVDREVAPAARALDEAERFPTELFARVAGQGWLGVRYPETAGGAGGDTTTFLLLCEELARGSLGLAATVAMQCLMGTEFLHRYGTPGQRERLFRPALRGEKVGVIAMTEPEAGSDLGAMRTRAVAEAGGWVLRGAKTWITNATRADFFIVAAKTNPEAGFDGIDLFLVERGAAGLTVGRAIPKLGARGSETAEVFLEDVRVPGENLFGGRPGLGGKLLKGVLAEIRVMTGALSLGLARAALDAALGYAAKRQAFGKAIRDFQAIRHKLAGMATELAAARALVYRAASEMDRGRPDPTLAAMAKLFASEMANRVADETTRIFGAYGFAMEYDAQRYFRDARFLLYGGGTSEILKDVIAQSLTR